MPATLDIFLVFTGAANTTNTPMGWEGGWVATNKVVGKGQRLH